MLSSQLSPSSVIIDPIDKIVGQKGSGAYFALGILALIIGIGVWITGRSDLLSYLSITAGGAIIFSSFLIMVRQYERAVVLRLGRYRSSCIWPEMGNTLSAICKHKSLITNQVYELL